ncbi:MAG: polysaccharide deacetylase family protein [Pseudomonadota bacterium]
MDDRDKPVLCLTFDNMGEARNVFLGKSAVPDPDAPGIRVGFPNILRLLQTHDLHATFFVEGWSALHYGDTIESLLIGGHEIGLHGWIHETFADLPALTARQFVNDGLQTLKLRGVQPAGFRAPGGRIGPYGHQILGEAGFVFDSSVDTAMPPDVPAIVDDYAGDGIKRLPSGLVNIPWQWFMIDAVHYSLARNGFRDPDDLAGFWSKIIRNVARERGFLTIICHAHVTGVDAHRLSALEKILKLALALDFRVVPGNQAVRLATGAA